MFRKNAAPSCDLRPAEPGTASQSVHSNPGDAGPSEVRSVRRNYGKLLPRGCGGPVPSQPWAGLAKPLDTRVHHVAKQARLGHRATGPRARLDPDELRRDILSNHGDNVAQFIAAGVDPAVARVAAGAARPRAFLPEHRANAGLSDNAIMAYGPGFPEQLMPRESGQFRLGSVRYLIEDGVEYGETTLIQGGSFATRLQRLFGLYERWHVVNMRFEYVPTVSKTFSGSVALAFDYDPMDLLDEAGDDLMTDLLTYARAKEIPINERGEINASPVTPHAHVQDALWTQPFVDDRWTAYGQLNTMVTGALAPDGSTALSTGTIVGHVVCHYSIQFYVPQVTGWKLQFEEYDGTVDRIQMVTAADHPDTAGTLPLRVDTAWSRASNAIHSPSFSSAAALVALPVNTHIHGVLKGKATADELELYADDGEDTLEHGLGLLMKPTSLFHQLDGLSEHGVPHGVSAFVGDAWVSTGAAIGEFKDVLYKYAATTASTAEQLLGTLTTITMTSA